MEDGLRFATENAKDLGLVAPGHRRKLGHPVQQIIVIGGGQGHVQVAQGFEDTGLADLERADGLTKPTGELAAIRCLQLAGDLLRRREHVIEVAGGNLADKTLPPTRRRGRD